MSFYVLDTSVLLGLGRGVFRLYDENDTLIIPITVIREVEKKKDDPTLGIVARSVLRYLEELRATNDESLRVGVKSEYGCTIRIELNNVSSSGLPESISSETSNDVKILSVAKNLGASLVSRDLALRLKAELVEVEVSDVPLLLKSAENPDIVHVDISWEEMDTFFETGFVHLDGDYRANQNIILHSGDSSGLAVLERGWTARRVNSPTVSGISGKNAEQRFALHQLMNPDVSAVALGGVAGSGKSLLALAAGVELVRSGSLSKVVIMKPIYDVQGGRVGFLPGTLEEKTAEHFESVFDALEVFMSPREIKEFVTAGKIQLTPLTHLRGRTLNSSFIILDETQSLELPTILTVLTRAGKNSKVVFTYDISQNDNPHVGKHQGISEAVSRMTGNPLFASVTFTKSERSKLAQMASDLLEDYIL